MPALEGYELAVNRGTRGRNGAPGPRYWQQWADYTLQAELNPVSKRMTGKGTIKYYNRSPDTLRTVYIQLLQNIFAPGARHNTNVPWSVEGVELTRVAAQGASIADGRRRRAGLRRERHDHAGPVAQAAGSGRHGRPRHSTGSSAFRPTARRVAARTERSSS